MNSTVSSPISRALISLPDRAARRMRSHGVGASRAPAGSTQPTSDNRCDIADQRGDGWSVGQRSWSTSTHSGPSRVLSCRADVVAQDTSQTGGTASFLRPRERPAVLRPATKGMYGDAPQSACVEMLLNQHVWGCSSISMCGDAPQSADCSRVDSPPSQGKLGA